MTVAIDNQIKARIAAFEAEMALAEMEEIKGGPGSGNWGHAGRPGDRGGSAPKKGPTAHSSAHGINPAMSAVSGPTAAARQAVAKIKGKPGEFVVAMSGGKSPKKVSGELYANGALGMHKDETTGKYIVTHTQSGFALDTMGHYNINAARKYATELAALKDVDWTKTVQELSAQKSLIYGVKVKDSDDDSNLTVSKPPKPAKSKKPGKSDIPTPGSGQPPAGKKENAEAGRQFLAAGLSPKPYGSSYDEQNATLKSVVNATWGERSIQKDDIAKALSSRSGLSYDKVNDMVGNWANTSADHNTDALKMQMAAAKVLGIELDPYIKQKLGESKHTSDTHTDEERERFIKAMYAHTQEQFAAAGFKPTDTIRVHRGVTEIPELDTKKHGDVATLSQNPMTSWSMSMGVAKQFSSGNIKNGSAMLTMDVPVSAIMGSCKTGFGCLVEAELIIADTGNHQALVRDKIKIPYNYED